MNDKSMMEMLLAHPRGTKLKIAGLTGTLLGLRRRPTPLPDKF
jgi:hypothetical protein